MRRSVGLAAALAVAGAAITWFVVARLGTVLRDSGPWLLAGIVLLLAGALALALAQWRTPAPSSSSHGVLAAEPRDLRLEALLATCEELEADGLAPPVLTDLVRVRTAAIVGLPPAERSGAVLSLDDRGRFYVLAVTDADRAMLELVPVGSRHRRDATAALDLWWDAVVDRLPPGAAEAIAPRLDDDG